MADQTPEDAAQPDGLAAEFDDLVLDEAFIDAGQPEASAEERVSRARRIARQNDALRREGEIADGSGKPAYQRASRRNRTLTIAAVTAVVIVVVALVVAAR